LIFNDAVLTVPGNTSLVVKHCVNKLTF